MLDLAKMQAAVGPHPQVHHPGRPGAALVESLRRPWRRTQLAFELGRLDERMLADIGMKRHEITDVAYKASRELRRRVPSASCVAAVSGRGWTSGASCAAS